MYSKLHLETTFFSGEDEWLDFDDKIYYSTGKTAYSTMGLN